MLISFYLCELNLPTIKYRSLTQMSSHRDKNIFLSRSQKFSFTFKKIIKILLYLKLWSFNSNLQFILFFNSILVYLHANSTVKGPITKRARMKGRNRHTIMIIIYYHHPIIKIISIFNVNVYILLYSFLNNDFDLYYWNYYCCYCCCFLGLNQRLNLVDHVLFFFFQILLRFWLIMQSTA